MYRRNLTRRILAALADTPVVFLAGARQTGKSTLVRQIAASDHPARYMTFDDLTVLAAAQHDPAGFVAGLDGDVILDEVQRAPEVLLPLKASVDRDRRSGRFLLTGSANVLALPEVAEPLVGRMETLVLWPLSQGELEGRHDRLIDALFEGAALDGLTALDLRELAGRIVQGGYPEAVQRKSSDRRRAWFDAYVNTLVHRDVRTLSAIEGIAQLPQLLSIVATRQGSRLNISDVSRTTSVPQTTLKRYIGLLKTLFLVHDVPPWSRNVDARLVKSGKTYLSDTGLAAHLIGASADRLATDGVRLGPLLETFVVNELKRQLEWAATRARLYHFQTYVGREVDVVIEDNRGRCVAIEVKAKASIGRRDIAGILEFADAAGDSFLRGIVMYTGNAVVPFSHNIHAVPVSALWHGR